MSNDANKDAREAMLSGADKLMKWEAQPVAVPQGWKLVPVEPTREMWAAVNKLDDQMTAGGYDGKGCTIEQAWDCMLAAAPAAPAPVALTDEQIDVLAEPFVREIGGGMWHSGDDGIRDDGDVRAFARAIERALGIGDKA